MQYRNDREGNPVSILGFGCMRFTKKGTSIDIDKAQEEILAAFHAGVNYYDTAYIYSGSEETIGKIFERTGIRKDIRIATKLPQFLVKRRDMIDRFFREELRRLRTDYIDYYLMHMLTDIAEWEHLCRLGIREWIAERKKDGSIRQIGFSFHGNTEMFLRILDAYDWDFCQIQYNYMDEVSQAGVRGLKAAAAKGIPVIIMEPLRGGKLVNLLPDTAKKAMEDFGPHKDPDGTSRVWKPAEWAFRWLWDQPEVTCVLSGMNSLAMVEENCRIASAVQPHAFRDEDFSLLSEVRESINANIRVNCTGCSYCMPCPKGVDIPGNFRCYNVMYTEGKSHGRHEFFQTIALRKDAAFASQCVGCGKCEKHCPQSLPIRSLLKDADKALRPLPTRAGLTVVRAFMYMKPRIKKKKNSGRSAK